ncbi:MAG: WD40 repeat domain-containing protein, partial [Anaerolineae bacterium]
WQTRSGQPISSPHSAAFSDDGNLLVVASIGGAVSLVDVPSGRLLQTWRHGSQGTAAVGVAAVAFSNDGRTVATAGNDGRARLWDVSVGARHLIAYAEMPAVLPASYCATPNNADCRTIVAAHQAWGILIWETSESGAAALAQMPISQTLGVTPDGRYVVVRAADNRVCAWATTTAQEISCLPTGQSPQSIGDLALGGREPMLAWRHGADELHVRRLPDFDLLVSVPVSIGVYSLAFSAAAPVLAVADGNKEVTLWDVGGRKAVRLASLPSPQGDISTLTFSSDGSALWLASGGQASSVISRWQTDTWQEASVPRLRVDTGITALAVSPKGDRLAVGGADGLIYLWDVTTGNEIGRLEANGVAALSFNGDGRVLFSAGGRAASVQIWPVDLQDLQDQARRLISRDPPQFTGAERRRYGLADISR